MARDNMAMLRACAPLLHHRLHPLTAPPPYHVTSGLPRTYLLPYSLTEPNSCGRRLWRHIRNTPTFTWRCRFATLSWWLRHQTAPLRIGGAAAPPAPPPPHQYALCLLLTGMATHFAVYHCPDMPAACNGSLPACGRRRLGPQQHLLRTRPLFGTCAWRRRHHRRLNAICCTKLWIFTALNAAAGRPAFFAKTFLNALPLAAPTMLPWRALILIAKTSGGVVALFVTTRAALDAWKTSSPFPQLTFKAACGRYAGLGRAASTLFLRGGTARTCRGTRGGARLAARRQRRAGRRAAAPHTLYTCCFSLRVRTRARCHGGQHRAARHARDGISTCAAYLDRCA